MIQKLIFRFLRTLPLLCVVGLLLLAEMDFCSKNADKEAFICQETCPEEQMILAFESLHDTQVATLPTTISCSAPTVEKISWGSHAFSIQASEAKNIFKRYDRCYQFYTLKFIPPATTFIHFCNFRS